MPRKNKTPEQHFKTIEYLLAGILFKREASLKKIAKLIGCSDKTLTGLYPQRKGGAKDEKG